MKHKHLNATLQEVIQGRELGHSDIKNLLALEEPEPIESVMSAARRVRAQHFGDRIFLYGFIYTSTYCRNRCTFCFYRRGNPKSPRYRKSLGEITTIATELADSGVHLLDLTMGEDPMIHDRGNYQLLMEMITRVKNRTGLPVMVSPGVVPGDVIQRFASASADWYALYQETHNRELFKKLRVDQSFDERCAKRSTAHRAGLLVEDGLLLGVGETAADRAASIVAMRNSHIDQVRVMSFVPQAQTPLNDLKTPSRMIEYLCIAVMRLVMPDRLIPASLDVDGIEGLSMRLKAGANVVTSIIPPHSNLAGVSQSTLNIEDGLRSVPQVTHYLDLLGLKSATRDEYIAWTTTRRQWIPEARSAA
jgi:methylornithine synthase